MYGFVGNDGANIIDILGNQPDIELPPGESHWVLIITVECDSRVRRVCSHKGGGFCAGTNGSDTGEASGRAGGAVFDAASNKALQNALADAPDCDSVDTCCENSGYIHYQGGCSIIDERWERTD